MYVVSSYKSNRNQCIINGRFHFLQKKKNVNMLFILNLISLRPNNV